MAPWTPSSGRPAAPRPRSWRGPPARSPGTQDAHRPPEPACASCSHASGLNPRPTPRLAYNKGLNQDLSISLAGLEPDPDAPWAAGPRAAIDWAATTGCRAVQLDATLAGLRPRELDRSARRDLAALLRRVQLRFSGLDLWIPHEHFADPARADRAIAAALAAIDLAAELSRLVETRGGPVVSLALPADPPAHVVRPLAAHAESRGVDIADHTLRPDPPDPQSRLGIGLDPAAVLLAGQNPITVASRAGRGLKSARLSDATTAGRTPPGGPGARLDIPAFRATLGVVGYGGEGGRDVVLDLRGLGGRSPAHTVTGALLAWAPSSPG